MMARAHPKLAMRPMLPTEAPLLAEIFRASIEELAGEDEHGVGVEGRLDLGPLVVGETGEPDVGHDRAERLRER